MDISHIVEISHFLCTKVEDSTEKSTISGHKEVEGDDHADNEMKKEEDDKIYMALLKFILCSLNFKLIRFQLGKWF